MKAYDVYDLAEKQLKAFTRSKVRAKVMLCLMDGDMKVGEIEEKIGIRATTILHAIKDMSEGGFISKTVDGYALTSIGRMQTLLLDELVTSIVLLDQQRNFWLTHDISGIPDVLLAKIGMLGQSEILTGDPAAILRTQDFFVSELMKSKEINGVSPIIVPDYPNAIFVAVTNGAKVNLILTKTILDIVIKEHLDLLKALSEYDNFKLYRIDKDIRTAFTVTDSYLSLGLFRIDGGYDVGNDLNSFGDEARQWGLELFRYYLDMSELIDIFN